MTPDDPRLTRWIDPTLHMQSNPELFRSLSEQITRLASANPDFLYPPPPSFMERHFPILYHWWVPFPVKPFSIMLLCLVIITTFFLWTQEPWYALTCWIYMALGHFAGILFEIICDLLYCLSSRMNEEVPYAD